MTTSNLLFAPLQPADLATLQMWFEDVEVRRRLGGMLPLQNYLDYVLHDPSSISFMVLEGPQAVGAVFVEMQPGKPGTFAFLVAPQLRGLSYRRRLLRQLLTLPETALPLGWRVGVEPDNLGCQRCLVSVGFALESALVDKDGFLSYNRGS